ncbi:MAG: hypothetical protein E6K65_13160 [Nitrospirae bacterium]|nr:MAG: hypothetical protein E6K65_13160 [Nitrospirota bacterium]
MPRASKLTLDERERRFVKGVVEGKPLTQAAKDAGYATSTAEKKSYAILQRPLVKSEMTKALERAGVTLVHIVQPIADALTATRSYIDPKSGLLIETSVPDHKIRLEASRDAVALFGGIPKVGEATPTAHGLNLFIAVDHGQGRSGEMPPQVMQDISPSGPSTTPLARTPDL